MPQGKNRYPGIRSFEPDDQRLFYGRSKEIDQLFNLIKIKPMVVLFGKSGLGKTSLLKAGVGPLLVKQRYLPVLIRLQDVGVAPSVSVLSELEQFVDSDLLNKFGNKSKNKIWETLKASSFKTADGKTATPVLIFDQFEELFSHPKNVQEEFTAFVGDLTENRLPEDIEDALNQVPRSERTKELMDWFRPPDVKIIFAIRSDRMSELHSLRHDIPAILQNRFELKPLKSHQAKEAVEKPAALEGEEFLTMPFSYAPETIEKIQTELSNEFGEIESFQLQIICQYIERKVKKEQAAGNQNLVITPDYLGEAEGIREILKNYYNTQVSLLGTDEEQMAARKLLEEGLIVNERRIGVAEAVVKESFHISDELLEKLLTSRLIRPEDTRLGRTYEISHDTLVKPILQAYEKRRIQEERLLEIQERLQIQKKQKRARNAAIVNFLIAVACAVGAYIAYDYYIEAEQLREDADNLREEAEIREAKLTELSNSLLAQDSILIELEQDDNSNQNDSLVIKRKEIEETKKNLKAALITSENKGRKDLAKINFNQRQKLINDLVSISEDKSKEARSKIVAKKYHNDPRMIAEILDALEDKDYYEYREGVWQIIYLIAEQANKEALKPNKSKVEAFIKNVTDAQLAASQTSQKRLEEIESKLK